MFCGDSTGNTSNGFYHTLRKLVSDNVLRDFTVVTAETEYETESQYLQELGFSVDRTNTRGIIFLRTTVQQLLESA